MEIEAAGEIEYASPARISSMPEADSEEEVIEVKEEMVSEVMRWLERVISCPEEAEHSCPSSPASVICGNQDSCGPSFSDSASTVMASIDTRGDVGVAYFFGAPMNPAEIVPLNVCSAGSLGGWSSWGRQEAVSMAGDEDEWLVEVLNAAEIEIEEFVF